MTYEIKFETQMQNGKPVAIMRGEDNGTNFVVWTTLTRTDDPAARAQELQALFGQLLFVPAEKLFGAELKDTTSRYHVPTTGSEFTHGHVRIQARFDNHSIRKTRAETLQRLQEARKEALKALKDNLMLQFWRKAPWDTCRALSATSVGKNKRETEFAEHYIFNEIDTEYGAGANADFHREKRKLDLIYGKIVEFSRHNGIEHPAYPSAQVRALCTKFYGQEAHPEFGRFTHGRFERDPFTKQ
jgi:hypothetical protein